LFQGVDVSDTLAHVLTKEPDLSKASQRSHKLLHRCLERDPRKRLRDIGDAESLLEEPARQASRPVSSRLPWAVAGTLAVALAAAVWASWRERPADSLMSQSVILPPEKASFFSPRRNSQAISPDGRQLVFAAAISGQSWSLWLRPLDSLAAHPLAGTEDAVQPFWSPDSRSIGFFAHGKLQRVDAAGGPAQPLADAPFPFGGTWSPSGVIVFASRLGALSRVPAGGGEAPPATHPKAGIEHRFPSFLPDGRHFLFQCFSVRAEQSEVYVGSLDSQDIKPLFRASSPALYSAPGYLLFLRESTLMAQPFDLGRLSTSGDPSAIAERISEFTVSGNRTLVLKPSTSAQTHLVWVDRAGKQISEAAPPGDYGFVDLSRDGKRVVFDGMAISRFEVWLRDLERGIASRLTFQPSNVPLWSPDGGTVVFASTSDGLDLSQRPSNMSAPEAVLLKLHAPPFLFPSDWSSDGRYLAYFRTDPKTRLDQWVLPMFGDRQPLAFLHGDFDESQGQFSPDDKWMAYVSDESGTPQINVVSFPTPAGIRQVSTAGGSQPRWRRDGKELFYIALDHKLMAVSVKTGATFETETPHPLFETTLPTTPLRQAYSVSPDGQRFLLTSPSEVSSAPLTLIQSWTAGLRK
jgi:eukaryotic-like serine/threonine-protein kinase